MSVVKHIFMGILIGIGAVAPGVSGGTFAMMLGIYEKLMDILANFYKDPFYKLKYIIPIGVGIVIGVLSFSNIIKYLFENHEVTVKFVFIGLMVGTLPYLSKEAVKEGFRKSYLIPASIAFIITLAFAVIDKNEVASAINGVNAWTGSELPPAYHETIRFMLTGAIVGVGTIIPGISSSFMLIYFGMYETLLNAVVNLNIIELIPIGFGGLISILLLAKVITYLFKHLYGATYHTVLGFVTGSIIVIIPLNGHLFDYVIGTLLGIIAAFCSYKLSILKR